MKKIAITDASETQLRKFALDTLGLEIHPNAKLETVIAKIQAVHDKPDITVDDGDQADDELAGAGSAPRPVTDAQRLPRPGYVRVVIAMREKGSNDPVELGVNGSLMLVKRGVEQDIPERYFHVLENAVQHVHDDLPDGKGMDPVPRKVYLYPFQVIARGPKLKQTKAA